jgi:hypothetical protein
MGAATIVLLAIFVLGFLPGYIVGYRHGKSDALADQPSEPETFWGEEKDDG